MDSLARLLDVTAQTIRRDVDRMARAGLLARFHGGVGLPAGGAPIATGVPRPVENPDGKRRIAAAVAARIADGTSLLLNLGSTSEAVAWALRGHRDLRVVTNNLNAAAILADNPHCQVIVCGGVVRLHDRGIVDDAAVEFLRQFRVDIGLVDAVGIDEDGTLRDVDTREARIARTVIDQSRATWLLADHRAFDGRGLVRLGHVGEFERLYTDGAVPEPFTRLLADVGVDCVIAAGH